MKKRIFVGGFSVLVFMMFLSSVCYSLESLDIGDAVEKPGSTEILPDGTITVIGAGHDIWDNADGFRYVYTSLSGDFVADVQVTYFERVQEWAKAGLMARQSLDADSINALSTAAAAPNLGVQLTWRADKNGETKETDYWELGGPVGFNDGEWIRLKRVGNEFFASWSKDGVEWVKDYTSIVIEMADPILVGLAVTSCEKTMSCKSVFKNFTINEQQVASAVSSNGKLSKTWGEVKSSY